MSNLPQLEEQMRKNEDDIESCIQLYVGMSWSEYLGNVGGETVLDINHPPIPSGMMDAAAFYQMLTDKENGLNECTKRIDDCTQKLEDIKKAEALLGDVYQNPYGNFARGSVGHNFKPQFELARAQAISDQKSIYASLWRYSLTKVVDAHRFQAELSALLNRKLELTISHKKSIALRMIELRGSKPPAN